MQREMLVSGGTKLSFNIDFLHAMFIFYFSFISTNTNIINNLFNNYNTGVNAF